MPSPFTFDPHAAPVFNPPSDSALGRLNAMLSGRPPADAPARSLQSAGSPSLAAGAPLDPFALAGAGSPLVPREQVDTSPMYPMSAEQGRKLLDREMAGLRRREAEEMFSRSPAAQIGATLRPVMKTIDVPGGAVRNYLAGQSVGTGLHPLDPNDPASGRDVLRRYGAAGSEDTWGNAAAGFAAEMALDPTNLIGGAVIKPLQKAARGLSPRYAGGIEKLLGAVDNMAGTGITRELDNPIARGEEVGFAGGGNVLGGHSAPNPYDAPADWRATDGSVVPGSERRFTRRDHTTYRTDDWGRAYVDQNGDYVVEPYRFARQDAADAINARYGANLPPDAIGGRNRLMEVFADDPQAMQRFIEELPPGSVRLGGGGMEGIAYRTPDGDVLRAGTGLLNREGKAKAWEATGYGLPQSRVDDPRVVQPTRNIPTGAVRVERLPYTPSLLDQWGSEVNIPAQELSRVKDMGAELHGRGVAAADDHAGNVGYRMNPFTGQRVSNDMQFLDPGLMKPTGNKPLPRARDSGVAGLTSLLEGLGATDAYAPWNRAINAQEARRGLGQTIPIAESLSTMALDPAARALGAYNVGKSLLRIGEQ